MKAAKVNRLGLLMLLLFLSGCTARAADWRKLPSLPDQEGFAGCFAGVSNGALIVGGGANFPDKKPWEGGKKVWYDTVFVLENPQGSWKVAGKLPRPLGYGVSVTHSGGIVCVGGSDSGRHYQDVFRLEWKSGQLVTSSLPPLPKPVANACGALVGDTLYIAGGQEKPDANETSKQLFCIDLGAANSAWRQVDPWPGSARMLAVAAAFDGSFWLVGGVDVTAGADVKPARRYLKDGFRFHPQTGWRRIADLPYALAAAPSPAPTDRSGFRILGGDAGSQLLVPPEQNRGFNRTILRYDVRADRWAKAGELPVAHVTTPCVFWNNSWVIPSGEVRPGVRSPHVWRVAIGGEE
jgi:N-acetylneuraminic acid mutarotase